MPSVKISVEKGYTRLLNVNDIAKSLDRHPDEIVKFLGYELATQSKYNTNQSYGEFKGKHDRLKIQDKIYEYINYFVMCPSCTNPETTYSIKKTVKLKCSACGAKDVVADDTHKLCKVIINRVNDIKKDNKKKGKKEKKEKKEKDKKEKNDKEEKKNVILRFPPNDLPRIEENDSVWRRIVPIHFESKFTKDVPK